MSIDEIITLDISERIILVEEIWDSIAKDQNSVPLSDYEIEVLKKRSGEIKEEKLLSWEDIQNRLRA